MKKKGKDRETANRNSYKEVPCVIGIDQSYTRTGIAICVNGKLKKLSSIKFKSQYNKTDKRKEVKKVLKKAIDACLLHYTVDNIVVVVERIRTYTSSFDLRPDFLKSQGALVATIVDTAYEYGISTYSVDTRCWKKSVLGTSKPVFEPIDGVSNPQKFGSVRKVIELGFKDSLEIKRGNGKGTIASLDDDAADAACISLYPFTGYPYNLYLER